MSGGAERDRCGTPRSLLLAPALAPFVLKLLSVLFIVYPSGNEPIDRPHADAVFVRGGQTYFPRFFGAG